MVQKKINGYTIFMDQLLGKGSYDSVISLPIQVYKALRDHSNQYVAIKIV